MTQCEGMLLEKTPLIIIFLIGILMWFCPLTCWCLNLTSLDLRVMQASQTNFVTHLGVPLTAGLALDGDSRTHVDYFTCSITKPVSHPWWMVDLGANHCLGRITLVSRGDCCTERLSGAIVRAGVDTNILNNAACGLPVTQAQTAIPGAHIKFVCVPPVFARHVSVDNPRDAEKHLTLCEVMVEEYPVEYCPPTTIGISTAAMITYPSVSTSCMSALMFVDKRVTGPSPLSVVHGVKSPMQCFLNCKMNNECLSFDYVMTSGLCRLYDVQPGDLKVDDQPGCLVYAVVRG